MRLGEAAALKLTQWAWLYTGKDRRLIGFDEDAGAWVSTPAILSVDTTGLGKPPAWATTADHREVRLSAPSPVMSDEMLGAVDDFRASHPYFRIQAQASVSVRLWHPRPVMSGTGSKQSA
jgi:hypothetical protein